jgi:DNA primase
MAQNSISEQVQIKINLVKLISAYIPLHDSRRVLRGPCPFHADLSNSLMVSPDKNSYKCFGCGREGGPIEFLMGMEGKSREETIELLAKKLV